MGDKKTKAELYAMLAEAVRNTQPQPVNTQREPVRDAQPAPKRTVKIKSVRESASRKRQPR
jgi:hypothetical protein